MYELDFSQERREKEASQKAEEWGLDQSELEQMLRRWGIRQILTALAEIHREVVDDGSKVEWRILSQPYLIGGYDDPNPCSCDDIF
ncbi:hypothetical protein [Leptothoe sp. PORK10 BA2]|uniref:hypothetical protein n=1 Tax=Leptothoe sp. PORK10 BA2 TaxID=3110254 RepID=UPI002B20EE7A|nr:hypothetical protein [Leptothoe sp. PORK10 BA2]MEA5464629.1 hypothetical protein [Leptothoe sp. PORK10 BA2]